MTLETLLAHYGLPALFAGAAIEGETVVVAGGLMAHAGLVPLGGAMAATAAGSFAADQLWVLAGRRLRDRPFLARMRARPAFGRVLAMLERHPIGFIFAFRFLYGLRTVSPVAIGTTRVPAATFVAVNAVSAVVWGTGFTLVGYLFGRAFEAAVGRVAHHLPWLLAALVVAGAVAAAIHRWRGRAA